MQASTQFLIPFYYIREVIKVTFKFEAVSNMADSVNATYYELSSRFNFVDR
jgi:hypothetical protein